jgi:hypothetical protein
MGDLLALLAVILCRTSLTGNDNLRKWMLSRDKGSCAFRQLMVPISFEYGLFKRELLCLSDSENRQVRAPVPVPGGPGLRLRLYCGCGCY